MPPPHTMKPMPSEGYEWSAGNYNPSELEKWKQKIYGAEYYDDETPAETPIWNQNNNENDNGNIDNKNRRKSNATNLSDKYFEDNIAAISSNWDAEDNMCHNILYQKPRAFVKKHFHRKNKHLMMAIMMIGMMAMMMGMAHMFRSGTEEAIPNTAAASASTTTSSSSAFSTTTAEAKLDERKPGALFETKTADMVMEEHSTIVSKKTRGSNRRNIRI